MKFDTSKLIEKIHTIRHEHEFWSLAHEIFTYQYSTLVPFRQYCEHIRYNPALAEKGIFPFLPVEFFKNHKIYTHNMPEETIFISSGTTGIRSRHPVASLKLYAQAYIHSFTCFYGNPANYCFLALLPHYMEQPHSSLIHMMQGLMQVSQQPNNGFFLHDYPLLYRQLQYNEDHAIPTILIGASYALLDFAHQYSLPLKHTIVMETGGMKGRRKEITREELHATLKRSFQLEHIHAEYGMTELMSQAYSKGEGVFTTPPWMKIMIREINDPFQHVSENQNGLIQIIDLYNLFSCSFIETQDIGKMPGKDVFYIAGRLDYSDMRGCNLLIQ